MIIGLHGRAGSGKDTFFHSLSDKFTRLAYADPLKLACAHLFNLTNEQLYDDKEKEVITDWKIDGTNVSSRKLLQWLGTDILRNHIDRDIFTKNLEHRLVKLYNDGHRNFMITDVRFDNEREHLISIGEKLNLPVKIIKIVRYTRDGIYTSTTSGHSSEEEFPDEVCDKIIINKFLDVTGYKKYVREYVLSSDESE